MQHLGAGLARAYTTAFSETESTEYLKNLKKSEGTEIVMDFDGTIKKVIERSFVNNRFRQKTNMIKKERMPHGWSDESESEFDTPHDSHRFSDPRHAQNSDHKKQKSSNKKQRN